MAQEQETQHALLVPWGHFAREIGLLSGIEAIKLGQKVYEHTPQAKVIEFLVAILSGAKYLQDISLAAHPLDKDLAVAQAWGQAGWADYTGVSRTMSALSWAEVHEIVSVLERVSQPFLDNELSMLHAQNSWLQYDGDLTGLPVSNTSKTYPNAAYGHMSDEIRLGYQAGVVSLQSPTYGRLWLSVEHHAGDTVSCTQAEAMVLAAERHSRQRPRRRTELLQRRIEAFVQSREPAEKRLESQRAALAAAQSARQETMTQLRAETNPKRIGVLERRCLRREKAVQIAVKKLSKTQTQLSKHLEQEKALRKRLEQFEQENAENPNPVEACFRLDAGFGTYDNIALLIEMGYEVYVKLHNHKIVQMLKAKVTSETAWVPVGNNAEMVAWNTLQSATLPLPARYCPGAFLHRTDPQTQRPGSFRRYSGNHRFTCLVRQVQRSPDYRSWHQRNKQVFYLHRLKVRSEPAIYLQEALTIFAANFIRWATIWIDQHAEQNEHTLPLSKMGIKKQVQVAAHTSAKVIQNSDGMLLKFSPVSAFAGKQLFFPAQNRVPQQNYFSSFFTILALIAQKLR